MTHRSDPRLKIYLPLMCLLVVALASPASAEWKEKVLYSFQGGADGSLPAGGVIFDKEGELYGLTIYGGSTACPPGWCGTFYQLSPPPQKGGKWTEAVLYVFKGHNQNDGSSPSGGLIADDAGNFYGVTGYGGSGPCVLFGTATGCGTVFELSPPAQKGGAWTETVLYNFQGGNDGDLPTGPLVFDKTGNLYGSTEFGGGKGTNCDLFYGGNCGAVFELTPPKTKGGQWTEKLLHSFANGADGATPNGGLTLDGSGMVYGTTYLGGYHQGTCDRGGGYDGCGTVFRLRPPRQRGGHWDETILHRFEGYPNDGLGPINATSGARGNIYGTTAGGGAQEDGVVFELKPPGSKDRNWKESLLHTFTGGSDGAGPLAGLRLGSNGSLYGSSSGGILHGVVFRMTRSTSRHTWGYHVLYNFRGSPDGYDPLDLTFGGGGPIFGTTLYGGTGQACQGGCGTVFEVSP
jgi:hypothetical protein